jgi:hypothetical protein
LNHHPAIAIPLESLFIIDYLRSADDVPLSRLRRLLLKEYELAEWGLTLSLNDLIDCTSVPQLIECVHRLYAQMYGKHQWGQKTPRFVRYGDLLKLAFPDARFIHLIRDPRAVVSSLTRSNTHRTNIYFAAKRWAKDVQAGLTLKDQYPDDVLEVRYEDLVAAAENTVRRVCTFLDVAYVPAMLDYYKTGSVEYGAIYDQIHEKINRPPQPDRIHAWRERLSPDEVRLVETICNPPMTALGYTYETSPLPITSAQLGRYRLQRAWGLVRQVLKYLSMRPGYVVSYIRRKLWMGFFLSDLWQVNY